MSNLVKIIRPEFNADIAADCLRFEVEGYGEMIEHLDSNGTLCSYSESMLHELGDRYEDV